jgi:polyhydroxyalkanoate synthesis regulator phasin
MAGLNWDNLRAPLTTPAANEIQELKEQVQALRDDIRELKELIKH